MENKTFIIIIACLIIGIALGILFGRFIIPYRPTSTTENSSVRVFMPNFSAIADVQSIPKPIHDTTKIKLLIPVEDKSQKEREQVLLNTIDSLFLNNPYINDMKYSTSHDSTYISPDNPSLKIDSHVDADFYLRTRLFEIAQKITATIADRDTVQVPVMQGMSFLASASIGAIAITLVEILIYAIFHK